MKKCTYCGAEYPDTAVRCVIDAEPLAGATEPSGVVAATITPEDQPGEAATALPVNNFRPARRGAMFCHFLSPARHISY